MEEFLELLEKRRSVVAKEMAQPGPDADQLQRILRIAARVPDHGKLAPWRFIIFSGEARTAFGQVLARRHEELNPETTPEQTALEAGRFERAPVVVGVVSRVVEHVKIPEWEQVLSAGAVCQNILVAASAMGFASQWLTEWYSYDGEIAKSLKLAENERMVGFVYLASAMSPPGERARPVLEDLISEWR